MLTVTRKAGDRVLVLLPDGREMWVTAGILDGKRVRLYFDAPQDVTIVREELLRKGQTEARSAGGSSAAID